MYGGLDRNVKAGSSKSSGQKRLLPLDADVDCCRGRSGSIGAGEEAATGQRSYVLQQMGQQWGVRRKAADLAAPGPATWLGSGAAVGNMDGMESCTPMSSFKAAFIAAAAAAAAAASSAHTHAHAPTNTLMLTLGDGRVAVSRAGGGEEGGL
ncbi:unnamed protein product [Closterium sp. Naga37s-1]|nr:unnamed protein product [Closterium sp. Naga37s-1]